MSKEDEDVRHRVVDARTRVKSTDGRSSTTLPRGARHDEDVMVEISKKEYEELKEHRGDRHAFLRDCVCAGKCRCRMLYYRYGAFRGYVLPDMLRIELTRRYDRSPGWVPVGPVGDEIVEVALCDSRGRCRREPNLLPYDDRRDYVDHKLFYPTLVPNPTRPTPIQEDPPFPEAVPPSRDVVRNADGRRKKNDDDCKKGKCWWIPVVIAVSATLGFVILIWIVASIANASTEKKMIKMAKSINERRAY